MPCRAAHSRVDLDAHRAARRKRNDRPVAQSGLSRAPVEDRDRRGGAARWPGDQVAGGVGRDDRELEGDGIGAGGYPALDRHAGDGSRDLEGPRRRGQSGTPRLARKPVAAGVGDSAWRDRNERNRETRCPSWPRPFPRGAAASRSAGPASSVSSPGWEPGRWQPSWKTGSRRGRAGSEDALA
jgi:hypothetical protein